MQSLMLLLLVSVVNADQVEVGAFLFERVVSIGEENNEMAARCLVVERIKDLGWEAVRGLDVQAEEGRFQIIFREATGDLEGGDYLAFEMSEGLDCS